MTLAELGPTVLSQTTSLGKAYFDGLVAGAAAACVGITLPRAGASPHDDDVRKWLLRRWAGDSSYTLEYAQAGLLEPLDSYVLNDPKLDWCVGGTSRGDALCPHTAARARPLQRYVLPLDALSVRRPDFLG